MKLAKSGVEIDGPHLRIAPAAHPVIDLDARLLDGVSVQSRPTGRYSIASAGAFTSLAIGGAVLGAPLAAMAVAVIPAGFLLLSHFKSREPLLCLELGKLKVVLSIADGHEAVVAASKQLAPWTRAAPITDATVYQDARRRLAAGATGEPHRDADVARTLSVGAGRVRVEGDVLWIGEQSCRVAEVRELAHTGGNLSLPGGAHGEMIVQAAIALLVVEADARSRAGEDLARLRQRISAYEAWTGHSAGR